MAATPETVKGPTEAVKEPEEIEVTIAVEGHKHQGELVKKGKKIKVHPDTARWMKEHNVIEG